MKELEITIEQAFKMGYLEGKTELSKFILELIESGTEKDALKLLLKVNIKMLEQEKKHV